MSAERPVQAVCLLNLFPVHAGQRFGRGVNFHGGGNGTNTPIAGIDTTIAARPLYYAMLFLHAAAQRAPGTPGPECGRDQFQGSCGLG
jgi:hypothetical protein